MMKGIVLVGILFLYYKFKLYYGEIEPNIYFLRLCKTDSVASAWSNINGTFLVNKSSAQNILVNLSDPNVTYKAIYGKPYSIRRKNNTNFFISAYDEITLEEAMKLKKCFPIHIHIEYFSL